MWNLNNWGYNRGLKEYVQMEKMPKSFEKKLRRFNKLINESMNQ